jgi:hypothetical protein
MAVALLPLARLRRFELTVGGAPIDEPELEGGAPALAGAALPVDDVGSDAAAPNRRG